MSKYIVTLSPGEVIYDGLTKYIKCPCDCYGVTDVILNNAAGEVIGTFSLCDATGKTTSDVENVWSAGNYIQVRFDLSSMKAQVLNGASSKHASQHAAGGSDPITPEDIGAAAESHTHVASKIKAGTFAETGVKAKTGTDYTTQRVRNAAASTTDLTAGSSSLSSGNIYLVYE